MKKRSDKYKEMLMIYLGGYATHKPYTVMEWFEARDYCNSNKDMRYKF